MRFSPVFDVHVLNNNMDNEIKMTKLQYHIHSIHYCIAIKLLRKMYYKVNELYEWNCAIWLYRSSEFWVSPVLVMLEPGHGPAWAQSTCAHGAQSGDRGTTSLSHSWFSPGTNVIWLLVITHHQSITDSQREICAWGEYYVFLVNIYLRFMTHGTGPSAPVSLLRLMR